MSAKNQWHYRVNCRNTRNPNRDYCDSCFCYVCSVDAKNCKVWSRHAAVKPSQFTASLVASVPKQWVPALSKLPRAVAPNPEEHGIHTSRESELLRSGRRTGQKSSGNTGARIINGSYRRDEAFRRMRSVAGRERTDKEGIIEIYRHAICAPKKLNVASQDIISSSAPVHIVQENTRAMSSDILTGRAGLEKVGGQGAKVNSLSRWKVMTGGMAAVNGKAKVGNEGGQRVGTRFYGRVAMGMARDYRNAGKAGISPNLKPSVRHDRNMSKETSNAAANVEMALLSQSGIEGEDGGLKGGKKKGFTHGAGLAVGGQITLGETVDIRKESLKQSRIPRIEVLHDNQTLPVEQVQHATANEERGIVGYIPQKRASQSAPPAPALLLVKASGRNGNLNTLQVPCTHRQVRDANTVLPKQTDELSGSLSTSLVPNMLSNSTVKKEGVVDIHDDEREDEQVQKQCMQGMHGGYLLEPENSTQMVTETAEAPPKRMAVIHTSDDVPQLSLRPEITANEEEDNIVPTPRSVIQRAGFDEVELRQTAKVMDAANMGGGTQDYVEMEVEDRVAELATTENTCVGSIPANLEDTEQRPGLHLENLGDLSLHRRGKEVERSKDSQLNAGSGFREVSGGAFGNKRVKSQHAPWIGQRTGRTAIEGRLEFWENCEWTSDQTLDKLQGELYEWEENRRNERMKKSQAVNAIRVSRVKEKYTGRIAEKLLELEKNSTVNREKQLVVEVAGVQRIQGTQGAQGDGEGTDDELLRTIKELFEANLQSPLEDVVREKVENIDSDVMSLEDLQE